MPSSLPRPVQRAIDAVNDGDTDAFVAAFANTGTVDDWGRRFTGHDAIRGWSDRELIGKNSTLDVTGASERNDTTVVIATVRGDGFNGPSTFTFSTVDDEIAEMVIAE